MSPLQYMKIIFRKQGKTLLAQLQNLSPVLFCKVASVDPVITSTLESLDLLCLNLILYDSFLGCAANRYEAKWAAEGGDWDQHG